METARKLETLQHEPEKKGFLTKFKQLKVGVIR
jgi:malate:Na+ symporter